jgi:cytoskeleton protein RodZ
MSTQAGGVGIGARLRAARERRGLTILQAAEKLHVDARVLECLEAENFEPLGAAVYVRGHLRRYAELVGESSVQLQELYTGSASSVRPDLTRIPRGEPAPGAARFMMPVLLVTVAIALGGLLWWLVNLPHARPQPLPVIAQVSSSPPVVTADATAPASPAPRSEGGEGSPSPPGAGPTTAPVSADAQTLTLRFSAASWVQIADAHGKVLLDGVQPPGGMRSVSGAAPLRVVLGNAPGVALEVNGRPASLEGLVRRRGDAHLLVDAHGSVSAAPPRPAGE